MDKLAVKVSDQDRAAAAELCDKFLPLSRQEEVAEIIAKHVGDEALREEVRKLRREVEELKEEHTVVFESDQVIASIQVIEAERPIAEDHPLLRSSKPKKLKE